MLQDRKPETSTENFNVRDWLLVALTVSSGAVDAISYFGLGKVFSAFMTGNIVYLGFGIANAGGPDLLPIVCALASFAVGTFLGTRINLPSEEARLWPRRVTFTLGIAAIAEAVFVALWMANAGRPSSEIANVLVIAFSMAMGLQTAAIRALGVQGVFTTAATFTLVAFAGAVAGSRPKAEVTRLAGVLLGLVAGAFAGGLLFAHARTCAPVLPLAITILVILAGLVGLRERRDADSAAAPP